MGFRLIMLIFASIVWLAVTAFVFFVVPPFTVVTVIVGNICGTGATALCTIYDFWPLTFWGGELTLFGVGIFWAYGVFDN